MDKKAVVHIGWMKLEPTIQSEVSQKEKHPYSILRWSWSTWVSSFDKSQGNFGSLAFVTLGQRGGPGTCGGFAGPY